MIIRRTICCDTQIAVMATAIKEYVLIHKTWSFFLIDIMSIFVCLDHPHYEMLRAQNHTDKNIYVIVTLGNCFYRDKYYMKGSVPSYKLKTMYFYYLL